MDPTHKASKFAPDSWISTMPDNVITNILDRLPLQEAVRTSVLSRNWRFKWTMLSQLIFDEKFYAYLLKTKSENSYLKIISRFLFHLKGAITKFALYLEFDEECSSILDEQDIAHCFLFLSEIGVKDLTIWTGFGEWLDLPNHLFSCLALTHLKLFRCFHPPASFHGFPNLLSLQLEDVQFESGKFDEFISQCPLIEVLNITCCLGIEKVVEIAKLTNLKILSLSLSHDDDIVNISFSSIFELLAVLPKLQELDLDFDDFKLTEGDYRKRSPTAFPCLKTFKLSNIDLGSGILLSFAFEIIRSSPNLQTLEITTSNWDVPLPPAIRSLEFDYNTMKLLPLLRIVFLDVKDSKDEVCFIEYLLACSPFLKNVVIRPHSTLGSDEKLMFARKLLELQRASPVAQIKLY